MKADKIIRTQRRSIGIQITPEGKVVVSAPKLMPQFFIDRFLEEKKDWIEKCLQKIHARPKIDKRQYEEGETFLYLGKPHTLHLGKFLEISIQGDILQVPLGLRFRIQKELTHWYIKKAKELITSRVTYHAEKMKKTYRNIMFSDTSSKWGTCTHENNLQFNWRLIMAPLPVIDYVVIHELTHTTHKHHGDRFWMEVALYTPAYRQHRKWLNTNQQLLVV